MSFPSTDKIKSGVFAMALNRENNVNRKLYNTYHEQTTEPTNIKTDENSNII